MSSIFLSARASLGVLGHARSDAEFLRTFRDSFVRLFGSSHKCVHDSAQAGRPRRGKRLRMCSCQLTSAEVVCRSVDGRLRGGSRSHRKVLRRWHLQGDEP